MSVMVEKIHDNSPTVHPYTTAVAAKEDFDDPIPHVAILQLSDSINSTGGSTLVAQARALRSSGQNALLLDLRGVSQLSTTGLRTLQIVVNLYAGEANHSDITARGWRWLRRRWMARLGRLKQPTPERIKLFGPKPQVRTRLERLALPVYDSLVSALMAV